MTEPSASEEGQQGTEKPAHRMSLEELFELMARTPHVFWLCPKGCRGFVDWEDVGEQMVATCRTCGEKSAPQTPRT